MPAPAPEGTSRHVLLISVDDLHASDLAQCEANRECPNLAARAGVGTTYTNAKTSEPSDSAPGLMALVTGGDPKLTGVYYDDSYSRDKYTPPAQTPRGTQDCSGPAGAETGFENVDNLAPTFSNPVGTRPIIGGSVDPSQLPYAKQQGNARRYCRTTSSAPTPSSVWRTPPVCGRRGLTSTLPTTPRSRGPGPPTPLTTRLTRRSTPT